jgi:hypothetical protein
MRARSSLHVLHVAENVTRDETLEQRDNGRFGPLLIKAKGPCVILIFPLNKRHSNLKGVFPNTVNYRL